jgi:acetyl-CoA carboxylase biotin carboxylase subunit
MKKILVANRGEIAMRVMRTCKEMGIKTVAVFSEADRMSPHVRFADEAVCIGPAPSNQSYLCGDKIIEVAKKLGVDGIHPGYGFLSENADFSQAVSEAGLTFIGPRPHAIRVMGSKLAAKEAARSYNIPLVPGTESAVSDIEEAKSVAREIGYPILIKASAGGGGKGMRIVERDEDLDEQMGRAVSEALNAFGDGSVFIEKYVSSPRHIEIQVLADAHGNVIHLFERECSVQRRHQKVIEEAPSVILSPEIREAMGKCACDVARSCDYLGAGTCEFIFDEQNNFYFLEMNTRLQVEHPVTELITGVDLVRQQILIAMGQALSIKQEDLKINGHAIQLRVYAEDPSNNFLPSIGKLQTYRAPKGVGVRVDDGYEEGMDIPIYYDPMIAKLITYGKDRNEAIARIIRAIDEYEIDGPSTTLSFGTFAFRHEAFVSGNFDTHFVKKHFSPEKLELGTEEEAKVAAMLIAQLLEKRQKSPKLSTSSNIVQIKSNWKNRAK